MCQDSKHNFLFFRIPTQLDIVLTSAHLSHYYTSIILGSDGFRFNSQGGMYVFHLMDSYAAGLSAVFLGIIEVIAIAWIYGTLCSAATISILCFYFIITFFIIY